MNIGPGPYQNFATPTLPAPREAEDYQPNEAKASKGGLPPIIASTKPERPQQKFHSPYNKSRRGKFGNSYAPGPNNWRSNPRQYNNSNQNVRHNNTTRGQGFSGRQEPPGQPRRPRTGRQFDPSIPRQNPTQFPKAPPSSSRIAQFPILEPLDIPEPQVLEHPQSITSSTASSSSTTSYQQQSHLKHATAIFSQENELVMKPRNPPVSMLMNLEEEEVEPRVRSPSPVVKAEKPSPIVKSEDPLMPAPPEKTLVTLGSERYFPLPDNCARDLQNPDWRKHRQRWVRSKCNDLKTRGLHIDRCFIRSSDIPVWSDTLLAPEEHSSPTPSLSILDILPAETSSRATSPDPDASIVATQHHESGVLYQPSPPLRKYPVATYSEREHDDAQAMTQNLALQFLERYGRTFDSNRACIREAYTEKSTLSSWRSDGLFSDESVGFVQGPARIEHALSSLPPRLSFSDTEHGLVFLGSGRGPQPEAMLTVQNAISDSEGPSLIATHVFLLRRPSQRLATDWPLEVCSHQIIVRDGQWIDPHRGQSEAFVGI